MPPTLHRPRCGAPVPGGLQRFASVFAAVTQGEITGNTPLDPEEPAGPSGALSHQQWSADEVARQVLQAEVAERFRHHDVILCPALPVVAIAHDTDRPPVERTFDVDGRPEPYRHLDRWCSIATVAKAPAVVVPVSQSATGLPVAVQPIGPHLEDRTALAAAALVERLVGFSPTS